MGCASLLGPYSLKQTIKAFISALNNKNISFKVNLFFPIAFLLGCIFIIAMTVIITPGDSLLCLVVILAGVPVYYIFVVMKKPKYLKDKIGEFLF